MDAKDRFRLVRERHGLSMNAYGAKIGLSASGVSAIEYGTRAMGKKHVKLICAAFPEISEHWLETGEGEMLMPRPERELPAELSDDPMIRAILDAYLDLDAQGRQIFQAFFDRVVANYTAADVPAAPDAETYIRERAVPAIDRDAQ